MTPSNKLSNNSSSWETTNTRILTSFQLSTTRLALRTIQRGPEKLRRKCHAIPKSCGHFIASRTRFPRYFWSVTPRNTKFEPSRFIFWGSSSSANYKFDFKSALTQSDLEFKFGTNKISSWIENMLTGSSYSSLSLMKAHLACKSL